MIDARISVGLPAHPKTKKLVRRLGEGGAWNLVCLFLWVAQNAPDGDLACVSASDIERHAQWQGEAGAFVEAARQSGYIDGTQGAWRLDVSLCAPGKKSLAVFGRVCSKTWRKVRAAIFERDGWACMYCGDSAGPLECDHIVPISRGGSNDKSNLVTACRRCNRSKRAKLVSEWRAA